MMREEELFLLIVDYYSGLYETSKFKTHPPGPLPFEEGKGEFFRSLLAFFPIPVIEKRKLSSLLFSKMNEHSLAIKIRWILKRENREADRVRGWVLTKKAPSTKFRTVLIIIQQ